VRADRSVQTRGVSTRKLLVPVRSSVYDYSTVVSTRVDGESLEFNCAVKQCNVHVTSIQLYRIYSVGPARDAPTVTTLHAQSGPQCTELS
jgi:hypothetical protein